MKGLSPFSRHYGLECQKSKSLQLLLALDAVYPSLGNVDDQRFVLGFGWHASDVDFLTPRMNP